MRFWLYSTYLASGRTNAAQLGGAEACFRPHLPSGEQLGGAEACFRPHLPSMVSNLGAQRYVPAPEIIISRISRICYRTSVLRNTLLVAREQQNSPAVPRNTLPVAREHKFLPAVLRRPLLVIQHGAGAKKCLGPAPLIISNILRVNNLSFSDGAGNHENSAPAPLGD